MGLRDLTLHDVILRNARLFPEREAWVSDDRRVTHREFLEQVEDLAAGLQGAGLRKGDRLSVLSPNCYEFVLLYGAAARLGAIVLPINWRLTVPEVEYILGDGEPRFLFLGRDFLVRGREWKNKFPFLEKIFSLEAAGEEIAPFSSLLAGEGFVQAVGLSGDDPYLIIPTAAVAGKPRGAVLSQGNLIAAALQHAAVMRLDGRDAYLHLLPLGHIADLVWAFAVMYAGGKNVLLGKFDPEPALGLISRERVTVIGDFPPILGTLLEKLEGGDFDISSLKHVLGIDQPATIAKMTQKTSAEFWTGFGQSETSGMVTLGPDSERPGAAGKEGPMARVRIVDGDDREAPTNTAGEICVRGPLVFLGYWNREEESRAAFRGGWHHTGDMGRLDENGYLWYLGRKPEKELIKPGGENVYPAEVEQAILEHPSVAAAVVIGVPDPRWGEAIKALCVLKPGGSLTPRELIDFVASRIARYKKPKVVEFLPALPRAPDGSIDRERVKKDYGEPRP